nr:VWA domain-containing protein [Candidatus Njordarchaeota archaeon]
MAQGGPKEALAGTPGLFQLVVFVLDGSASMTWEGTSGKRKADEIYDAIDATIKFFKTQTDPNLKAAARSILVQMIAFSSDQQVKVILDDFTAIGDIDVRKIKPPTDYWSPPDGTCIHGALTLAQEETTKFVQAKSLDISRLQRPTILLLTDGCENFDQNRLLEIAEEIKAKKWYLAVVQYGKPGATGPDPNESQVCPEVLKSIATSIEGPDYDRVKKKMDKYFKSTEEEISKIFLHRKLYTEALDEKAARIFFIGGTTISYLSGGKTV